MRRPNRVYRNKKGKFSVSKLPVLSSAGQIKSVLKKELVDVEDWGVSVWVFELTAGEADEYRVPMYQMTEDNTVKLNMAEQSLRLAAVAARDEHGNRIFPDTVEGVEFLKEQSSAGVETIATVARRLSNLSGDSAKKIEGNSEAGKTGASPSA